MMTIFQELIMSSEIDNLEEIQNSECLTKKCIMYWYRYDEIHEAKFQTYHR